MGSEQPDIAGLRYRNVRDVRGLILVRQPRLYPRKGDRQFLGRKAQRRKVSAHTREIPSSRLSISASQPAFRAILLSQPVILGA